MTSRPAAETAMAAARALAVALVLGLGGCTDEPPAARALTPDERALLLRAFERATSDSIAMVRSSFNVGVELATSITDEDTSVRVLERFRLVKQPGSGFTVTDRTQEIGGDRELLGSMYSFENSRGELRSETEARLESVGFGADGRRILDDLLHGRLAMAHAIIDSIGESGRRLRVIGFNGEDLSGALEFDEATLALLRVTTHSATSAVIGGYEYAMSLELTDPSAPLRLPLRMKTEFEYERLTSSGSGTVLMSIDTTGMRSGRTGAR
jgi:hypothetical protein